ncbi:DsbA family oxidoreductase [Methylocapsa polymorpha]|uniref:DsbA family oxidoreductase n=1 Tax=Methylocapsa polymorpha TaxID=3080828 RepID=A0ABZ0HVP7_9HYPH|nr:DsbA family oxidoreductase [Methylocapsa sp. RX1]
MSGDEPGPIPIDIVGDLVCPYCFIGLRLAHAVVGSVPGLAVDIRWYPFQLDPESPPQGQDRRAYLEAKFGADGVEAELARAAALAREFGLELAFDKITRQPNTFDAHRLIRFSYGFGVQAQIVERLFQAFFLQGQDIGDRGVLCALAAKSRMDPGSVEQFLDAGDDAAALRREMADIRASGVEEVPRFTFAGKQDIVGIKTADVFADALFNSIDDG